MKTALVTGASGFIAKHVVVELLNAGFAVVGSLRTPSRADEVITAVTPHLSKTDALDKRLRFVTLDLDSDAGWDKAMEGVDVLVHTAAVFPMANPNDRDALIRTNVDGTLRALRATHAAGVKRVVLTSSVAATGSGDYARNRPMTEDDWTDVTNPKLAVYTVSKTLAERAAWDYVAEHAPDMALTTINPALVVGPPLDAHYGTSCAIIERLMAGKDPMLPDIDFNIVDVRDIARMHVRAIQVPESAGKRFIGANGEMTFQDIALALKEAFPDLPTKTRVAPNVLIRLLGLFDPAVRGILPALGKREFASGERAKMLLGITFTDPKDAVVATARAIRGFRAA